MSHVTVLSPGPGFNPLLLSAQVALAVQNNQTNPFLSAYTNILASSGLLPSIMAERLKSARFSPYLRKEKMSLAKQFSSSSPTIKCSVQTTVRDADSQEFSSLTPQLIHRMIKNLTRTSQYRRSQQRTVIEEQRTVIKQQRMNLVTLKRMRKLAKSNEPSKYIHRQSSG